MKKTKSHLAGIPRDCSSRVDRAHAVYELDLWLIGSDPIIWRTIAVSSDFTLERLHYVIQCSMGWEDDHLHCFETQSGRSFEPSGPVGSVDAIWSMMAGNQRNAEDEADVPLSALFDELREALLYVYDFGDNWRHGIRLVDTHEDPGVFKHLPMCLDGRRAGPPEDSGGVWGYEEKLEVLRCPDPDDDWHGQIIEWIGEDFDPDRFDVETPNRFFRRVRRPAVSTKQRGVKRRKSKSR